jgi:hypothetical protein
MAAVKFSDFCTLFENIAINHVDINHTSLEKHFVKMNVEDLLLSAKIDLQSPAIVLEGYDWRLEDHQSDNTLKHRTLAFCVMVEALDKNDIDTIYQAFDDAEELADEILALLWKFKRTRTHATVKDMDLNAVDCIQLENKVAGWVGVRVLIDISSGMPLEIDTEKWETTSF